MLDAVRNFIVFCGIGSLLLLVGSVLLFSTSWPRTWQATKEWIQKPVPLAGVICLAFSLFFVFVGGLSLLG